jgi:hydrogenase small subunit
MKTTLFWLQCGGCGGDTMSLLNASSPTFIEAVRGLDLNILWHPSFSVLTSRAYRHQLDRLLAGSEHLTVLCVEGAPITGPNNTGRFDMSGNRPKTEVLSELAERADYVVAVGTCAAFGGVSGSGDAGATGLQFHGRTSGGLLGTSFRSATGLPVINIPGCPCHPTALIGTLSMLLQDGTCDLTDYQAPVDYFSMLVHQGCTRNEYHEYQIEETDFGEKGCLFFHMGCHGPLAHGPCNKYLWNGRNCKTRSGVPCFGCTEPDFPQATPFFETPNIVGLPINLPDGVDRPHYLAYKGMAAAAAPERLKHRKTKI